MSGGAQGGLFDVRWPNGDRAVAKFDPQDDTPGIEGRMLEYLADQSDLPVPEVFHRSDHLLVMEFIDAAGTTDRQSAERNAARIMANLHDVTAPHFGLDWDTRIGGLHQPNDPSKDWVEFFAEHRLREMADRAHVAGRLPDEVHRRVLGVADSLDDHLDATHHPSLIHGDAWGGNIMFDEDTVAAFIDPAIYYADPEIELAFTTLFSTFSDTFYEHYDQIRGIRDGFWEKRCDLYNLYPLLVHVRLFGGGYVRQIEGNIDRLSMRV
jgi:fructosamine-3-kinase